MEHFSAVKFAMGYEEKYELPCDTKISKCLKKSWKDRTGLLLRSSLTIKKIEKSRVLRLSYTLLIVGYV